MFAVTCILFGNPTLESTETHSEDPKGKLLPSPLHQALPSQSTNKEWFHPQLTVTTRGAFAIFIGLLLVPENVPPGVAAHCPQGIIFSKKYAKVPSSSASSDWK